MLANEGCWIVPREPVSWYLSTHTGNLHRNIVTYIWSKFRFNSTHVISTNETVLMWHICVIPINYHWLCLVTSCINWLLESARSHKLLLVSLIELIIHLMLLLLDVNILLLVCQRRVLLKVVGVNLIDVWLIIN